MNVIFCMAKSFRRLLKTLLKHLFWQASNPAKSPPKRPLLAAFFLFLVLLSPDVALLSARLKTNASHQSLVNCADSWASPGTDRSNSLAMRTSIQARAYASLALMTRTTLVLASRLHSDSQSAQRWRTHASGVFPTQSRSCNGRKPASCSRQLPQGSQGAKESARKRCEPRNGSSKTKKPP